MELSSSDGNLIATATVKTCGSMHSREAAVKAEPAELISINHSHRNQRRNQSGT